MKIFNRQKGQMQAGLFLIGAILLTSMIVAFLGDQAFLSVNKSIGYLEDRGYVVFAAEEYADIVAQLNDIEAEIEIVEVHLHSPERWMGISGDQSGNDWALVEGLNPYRAISGNIDFGSDPNDEAKVIGTDDTPIIAGNTLFDLHRIQVTAASVATDWVLRVVWGSGTMANAVSAGQYSDVMVQEAKKGSPIEVQMPRTCCTTDKVWVIAKNATNNATIDFFVGVHGYVE